jgi:pimeloyl-ACP methyl ester carboxylesterase
MPLQLVFLLSDLQTVPAKSSFLQCLEKSVPCEPIRNADDYVGWLSAVLDTLQVERISLAGMSFGGWLALNFAIAAPQRVQSPILLSPAASVFKLVRQFGLRGIPMMMLPTRFTVNSFMRWLGFTNDPDEAVSRDTMTSVIELTFIDLKHFRFTRAVPPTVFSDTDLQAMQMPTLLLMGEHEVIYDRAKALS